MTHPVGTPVLCGKLARREVYKVEATGKLSEQRLTGGDRIGGIVEVVEGGYMVEFFDEVYGQMARVFFPETAITIAEGAPPYQSPNGPAPTGEDEP